MPEEEEYQRMWENKGHRPYWAQLHVYAFTKPFEAITGFKYKDLIFHISKEGNNKAYLSKEEMEKATVYFKEWWQSKENINQYFQKIQEYFKKTKVMKEKVFSTNLSTLSTKELVDLIDQLANIHGFSYIFVTQPQHVVPLEEALKEKLKILSDQDKLLALITTPKLPLPHDEEEEELQNYRKVWETISDEEKAKIIFDLSKKYGWFANIEGEQPYDEKHYEQEIITRTSEQKKDNFKEQTENDFEEVSKEIKKLGYLIGVLSNQRIWARYYGMTVRYGIKLCIKELEKRWNIPELEYATIPEIKQLYLIFEEMTVRKEEGYIATIINDEPMLLTREKNKPLLEKIQEKIEQTDMIRGNCANPGKVQGKVRIVSFTDDNYYDEIAQFQQGEILVTGMTRPQIAHLCHKASAIVTDEGGITSHASIISREYNIPCIIGTNNATKVLKTGDIVEVNAEKGTVKKLDEK